MDPQKNTSSYFVFQEEIEKELNQSKENNFLQELESVKIDRYKKLELPKPVWKIKIDSKTYNGGTCENFSVFIGKPKSKKTFAITLILAEYLKTEKSKKVLYFDTEQGEYHVQKAINRLSIKNNSIPENIEAYHLRSKDTAKRLKLIEECIYHNDNVELVIIDGIRDLVTSINDESEATMITSKLMKWTEERKIHIITVLHQNKGDNNARGHVGSELMNKAELVLSITKDENDKDISIIQTVASRDLDIIDFAFCIDEKGIPNIIDNWKKPSTNNLNKNPTKALPHQIGNETYKEILNLCFAKDEQLKHSDLVRQLQLAIMKLTAVDMSVDRTKKIITHLLNENLIQQRGTPKTTASHYVNMSNGIIETIDHGTQSKIEI